MHKLSFQYKILSTEEHCRSDTHFCDLAAPESGGAQGQWQASTLVCTDCRRWRAYITEIGFLAVLEAAVRVQVSEVLVPSAASLLGSPLGEKCQNWVVLEDTWLMLESCSLVLWATLPRTNIDWNCVQNLVTCHLRMVIAICKKLLLRSHS